MSDPKQNALPLLDERCLSELSNLRTDGTDDLWREREIHYCRERQLSLYQRALSIACFTLTGSVPPEAHENKITELLAMARKELER